MQSFLLKYFNAHRHSEKVVVKIIFLTSQNVDPCWGK